MRLALVLALLAAGAAAQPGPPAQGEAPPAAPPPLPELTVPPVAGDETYGAPISADTLRPAPSPPVLEAYRADPDFQYDDPEAEGPTLWEAFWGWIARTLWRPIAEGTTREVRGWVMIGLAALVLGWAASRLLRAEGGVVFARGGGDGGVGGPLLDVEDIGAVDLASRLRAAEAAGDLREAVRVRYLLALQGLDAAGAIRWRRDKTNRQYVAEVAAAGGGLEAPFRRATRAFDAVWYGERAVSQALYRELGPVFDRASTAPRAA